MCFVFEAWPAASIVGLSADMAQEDECLLQTIAADFADRFSTTDMAIWTLDGQQIPVEYICTAPVLAKVALHGATFADLTDIEDMEKLEVKASNIKSYADAASRSEVVIADLFKHAPAKLKGKQAG